MIEMTNDSMKRMQRYLGLLRMCMGMTQAEFGEELGVSRQQIWNLEHGYNQMTRMHFSAINWLYYCREGLLDMNIEDRMKRPTMARFVYDFVIMSPEMFNDAQEEKYIISLLYIKAPLYMRVKNTDGREAIEKDFFRELMKRGYDDFYDDMKKI